MRPNWFLLALLFPLAVVAAPGSKVPPGTSVMLMAKEFSPEDALKGASTSAPMAYRVGQLFEAGRDKTPEEEKAMTEASYQMIVPGGMAKYTEAQKQDRAARGVDLEEAAHWYARAFALAEPASEPLNQTYGPEAALALMRLQSEQAPEHLAAGLKRYPTHDALLWARYKAAAAPEKAAALKAVAAAAVDGGAGKDAQHELALVHSGTHELEALNKAVKQDLKLAERYESEVQRITRYRVGTAEPSDLLLALRMGGAGGPEKVTEAAAALNKRLEGIRRKPDLDRMLGLIEAVDQGPDRALHLGAVRAVGALAFGDAAMGMLALENLEAAGRKDMRGAMAMQLYKQDGKGSSLGGTLTLTPAQKKKARAVWASYVETLERATGQRFPDEQRPPKD